MNWVAIVIAVIVNMALGALWCSPLLFVKPWMAMREDKAPMSGKASPLLYVITAVGALVSAITLDWTDCERTAPREPYSRSRTAHRQRRPARLLRRMPRGGKPRRPEFLAPAFIVVTAQIVELARSASRSAPRITPEPVGQDRPRSTDHGAGQQPFNDRPKTDQPARL